MAKFLLSNGFHNSSSTTAKGILLTGHLIPATTSILTGAWLVFEKAKLEVVEVRILPYEQVELTISPDSTDQLAAVSVQLYTLYGTEAIVVNPG
jgi:hypothetical protein